MITNKHKYRFIQQYFYNFKIFTCVFVYGPKYETEYIVFLFNRLLKQFCNIKTVFDVGAGSGCVGITIKLLNKHLQVTLCDKNPYAINCINKNLVFYNLTEKVLYGDLLLEHICCDVIVCNPPYILSNKVSNKLSTELKDSICGGESGLSFIVCLFAKAVNVKYIVLELGSIDQFYLLKSIIFLCGWKCIDFIKPYTNMQICFCTFASF